MVEGTNERQDPYIIVPGTQQSKNLPGARLVERLRNLDINAFTEIPLIKGFTAVLNEDMRRNLERNGFKTIPDNSGRFLHPNPWERRTDEVRGGEALPESSTPRADLSAPRYLSPLTQEFTGKGVGIAIVDTGIYPHPDLTSPQNRVIAFKDFVNHRTLAYDDNGHGTHVAGDAAGNGHLSEGLFRGTAPDANLIGVKVLDANGNGSTSNILRGINWAVENKARYNIRVLNLSLGTTLAPMRGVEDPITQAVERATAEGIVVVVSAGNTGPRPGTICSPGDSPAVITVGAVDDRNTPDVSDDRVTNFSGRGLPGGGKPDLVAPGEQIIGPNAPGTSYEATAKKYSAVNTTLGYLNGRSDEELTRMPEEMLTLMGLSAESVRRIRTSAVSARAEIDRLMDATERMPMVQGNYIGMPGTSTAAPIVAGVVAQILEANPNLTPSQVKDILTKSATPMFGVAREAQGAGLLNPDRALSMAIEQDPDSQVGQLRFPGMG